VGFPIPVSAGTFVEFANAMKVNEDLYLELLQKIS
jgi:hypothetical protein